MNHRERSSPKALDHLVVIDCRVRVGADQGRGSVVRGCIFMGRKSPPYYHLRSAVGADREDQVMNANVADALERPSTQAHCRYPASLRNEDPEVHWSVPIPTVHVSMEHQKSALSP